MFRTLGVTQFKSIRLMLSDFKGLNDPEWNFKLVYAGNSKHFLFTLLNSISKDGTM